MINERQKERIYEAHNRGMTLRDAALYAGVTHVTVSKYWRERGLEAHFRKTEITNELVDKICEAHEVGMSASEAAGYAGVSTNTIYNIWGDRDLETTTKIILNEKKEKVKEAHKLGMNGHQAARYASVSNMTVYKWWRSYGLKPHHNTNNVVTTRQIRKIMEANAKGMSIREAMEYVGGVSHMAVKRYWERFSLKTNFKKNEQKPSITEKQLMAIIEARRMGMNCREAAEYVGGVSHMLVWRYWKKMDEGKRIKTKKE